MTDIDCPDFVLVIAWARPRASCSSTPYRDGTPGEDGRAPQAVVLSVAGERFGMGEELSPVVRRALPRAIRTVIRQARAWAQASSQTAPPA